jgi:hypothetical protein
MSDKYFIKNIKRRNKSKDFILPFNIINLSNDPSLKDLTIKPPIKIQNYNNNISAYPKKKNQGTNTIYSILKKAKNKNMHNYFNVKRKRIFPDLDDYKYGEDWNCSTIRSNGKFQISNNNNNNNIEKNGNNISKKIFIKQNIKKFILNGNNYSKINENGKRIISKELITNNYEENKKKEMKDNWKGLNISSHYLGNTFGNKFGITTNKFCINKNIILTHSKDNKKYLNNYNTNSLILNNKNDSKLKFITLNIPNNNFFNSMTPSNIFSKVKCVFNNEKLYQKLIKQMTIVFKNRIKKYSELRSYEKQQKSIFNDETINKINILNMKQQRLFNERYFVKNNQTEKKKIEDNINAIEKNEIFSNISKDKYKIFDIHCKYMKINIRNANKQNNFINNTLSNDDIDMFINKRK